MRSNPALARCRDCRTLSTKDDIWLCVQCRSSWCDKCWDKYPAHNPSLENDDPFAFDVEQSVIGAHEKVSKEVFARLTRVFATLSKDDRQTAHEAESRAKWFGVSRGEGNQLYFGDTNRLTSIINDSWTAEYPDQYPSIVSFVGETGPTLEKVVSDRLIPWAAQSIYKSLNQAVPPHVIIVINGEDISIREDEWNYRNSTNKYLESLKTPFENDRNLTSIVQTLESKVAAGISTHADLLKHFYSSVTFVNIPQKAYLMRMDAQLGSVYDVIKEMCSQSHRRKEKSRVLLKAERLERVLAAVFEHFSQETDKPFDFLMDSLWQSPIPGGLDDNILRFFRAFQRAVKSKGGNSQHDAPKLFGTMTPIISSQILLDSVRSDILGISDTLLGQKNYGPPLRKAFHAFCETSLHCAFEPKAGGARCCNVKANHGEKGHQGADGKSLGKGTFQFQSGFEPVEFFEKWQDQICQALDALSEEHRKEIDKDGKARREAVAAKVHQRHLTSFLSNVDIEGFLDHHICLCCLRHSMPEYPMPCGKVLCAACVRSFKSRSGREPSDCDLSKNLTRCPFHANNDPACSLEEDEKPRGAGVRILCLDGGGVRGIIQLALLKAIEDQFNGHLKIQWFFDLVVGTSTGGIIALNLFVRNRPLQDCIKDFKTLCNRAFSPRELKGIPVLGKLAMMNHGSVFKTRPFESILQSQEILGKDTLLFGGPGNHRPRWHARVAVTTTDQTSKQRPAILANYNRPEYEGEVGEKSSTSAPYVFLREARPCSEMKIWEAARATSAAFPYFKPFFKREVQREFVDGGLYHNCPVKIAVSEKRLLWSDVRMDDPDILLSLGTGKRNPAEDKYVLRPNIARIGRRGIIGTAWELTAGLLENVFEGQSTWSEFYREATEQYRKPEIREYTSRYIRLNVDIPGVVPKLYMFDKVDEMESLVHERGITNAEEIAHRLVASCFYLLISTVTEHPARDEHAQGSIKVTGTIECRFCSDPARVKALGNFLNGFLESGANFAPSFLVQTHFDMDRKRNSQPQPEPDELRYITAEVIERMRVEGAFSLPPVEVTAERSSLLRISIHLEREAKYSHNDGYLSISGFPRSLEVESLREECRANRKESGYSLPITNEPTPPPSYESVVNQGPIPATGGDSRHTLTNPVSFWRRTMRSFS
ncbi:acyl transferase/acyl hydrolase/lysophospholipase [Cladorrhinum sp. PSN332]|nr:acyl transferase/acyl hydrolase/lysophospholipase [Cladorrhinum sp. PSN332]